MGVRTMEIQDDAVLPPRTNPVQFCALGKLVRERLGVIFARPRCVGLRGRRPDHRLEFPGSPRPRPHEVSDLRDARGAAPRATFILMENPKCDRKSCSRHASERVSRREGAYGYGYVRRARRCGAMRKTCQRESGGKVSRR